MTKSELRKQLMGLKKQFNESNLLDEMLELSKQIQSTIESIMHVPAPKLLDTYNKDEYTIELYYATNDQDWDMWKVKVFHKSTGELNEDMSDTVYMSLNAAMEFINSIPDTKQPEQPKQSKQPNPTKKQSTKQVIPAPEHINMIAQYAKIIYSPDIVNVNFENSTGSHTITFKRRKSWSHKKYVNEAMKQSGIQPSYDFRYGWQM